MSLTAVTAKGVTLVELVITIVIMSVALLAVVSVYSRAIYSSADPMIYAKAVELGQAYLEEILTKKYDENTPTGGVPAAGSTLGPPLSGSLGPDAGESRPTYDDVDDFDGLSDTVPVYVTGDDFNDYVNYQVTVNVSYVNATSELPGLGINNNDMKRIQVNVSNPLSNTLVFAAYKGNF
ncbi:MAG: prepilin-type N-terminal cleavage/methylation domain-containing protein [Ketobacteraceae bacterium]|nr:prepilin-type N-terminal cleavage/methylation domain-containing protein [Ketobacteraceae bacterium]